MFAVYAARFDADNPLNGLELGERPEPEAPEGWTTVTVKAASLNHHDLWTLRGVGIRQEQLPMILGCDAAGVDADGNEVIVHSVIGDPDAGGGDETLDPRRSLLSERHQGTFAEQVIVPRRNLVPKPKELSFEEAACLPTAWLTAYRAVFVEGGAEPGDVLLVQGAGGGVATAATVLGVAAGLEVHVTSRSAERRARAESLGATAHEPGSRLPRRADVVLESVGRATWEHSVGSVRAGGTIVVVGATTGDPDRLGTPRLFFHELRVVGVTMGSVEHLRELLDLLGRTGARPVVDRVLPLAEARAAFERLDRGEQFGKVVLRP